MRTGLLCALLVLIALAAGLGWHARLHDGQSARGKALFYGEHALTGRIAGNEVPLPGMATRCVNCHESVSSAPAAAAGTAASVYATALDRAHLVAMRSRRGGPVSQFDRDAFCMLLRTGIDPGHIIVSTVMPRYELSATSCAELWTYLVSR